MWCTYYKQTNDYTYGVQYAAARQVGDYNLCIQFSMIIHGRSNWYYMQLNDYTCGVQYAAARQIGDYNLCIQFFMIIHGRSISITSKLMWCAVYTCKADG